VIGSENDIGPGRTDGHSCKTQLKIHSGSFSNNYLTKRALRRLREEGFRPYWRQRESPDVVGYRQIACARAH